MDRDGVIALLRAHEAELRAAGVVSLSLFGSLSRGEHFNDIDLAVRLGTGFSAPGLDYFGRLDDLQRRLCGLLGEQVDLVEEPLRNFRFNVRSTGIAPLPSEKPARRLRDIIENAQAILRYSAQMG
jgi:predicted nucleotidyltransferase